MKRTKIVDIFAGKEAIGSEVSVMGWVRTRRGNKHVQFVALNDGSTIKNLQIVLDMAQFTDEQAQTGHHRLGNSCQGTPRGIDGQGADGRGAGFEP